MSEKKTNQSSKRTNRSKQKTKPTTTGSKEDSIFAFYVRAILLAVFFGGIPWYIFMHDYHDMGAINRLATRINNQDATVTLDDYDKVQKAQEYFESKNFEWFHSYKWLLNAHLGSNLQQMELLDTASLETIKAHKLGVDYRYIKYYILDKTPEDAVILMPDYYDFKIPDDAPANTVKFHRLVEKAYVYYFAYPRTLIYDFTDGSDTLLGGIPNYIQDPDYEEKRKNITHVAIVHGKGYEHLNYYPKQRELHTVLPIDDSTAAQKN